MEHMMELVGSDQGGPTADAAVVVNPSPDATPADPNTLDFHGSSTCIKAGPPPGETFGTLVMSESSFDAVSCFLHDMHDALIAQQAGCWSTHCQMPALLIPTRLTSMAAASASRPGSICIKAWPPPGDFFPKIFMSATTCDNSTAGWSWRLRNSAVAIAAAVVVHPSPDAVLLPTAGSCPAQIVSSIKQLPDTSTHDVPHI
jgi:hypothetical protein